MRASCLLILAVLAACGSDDAPRPPWPEIGEAFPDDAWLRPEWQRSFTREHLLPPTSYRLVPDAELAAALERLGEERHVLLTAEDAARFGADELSAVAPSDVLVLLRALRIGGEPDSEGSEGVPGYDLQVMWSEISVCVEFSAYRDRHCPQVRSAVLAWLPAAPSEVCVRAGTLYYGGVR